MPLNMKGLPDVQTLKKKTGWITLTALVCVFLIGCVPAAMPTLPPAPPPRLDPFYTPPDPLPSGQPGEIIRTAPMDATALKGARLWRVLYHSTTLAGNDIAVSGLMAQPSGTPPPQGFPVVAIGHGTSGIARACAPSINALNGNLLQASFYARMMEPFVNAGYAVVVTDYQGMGAPGDSAYLIGLSEGRNVLDVRRAIRNFDAVSDAVSVSDQTFIWGVSQGGHAAAFAGELAATYAPELKITGVVMEAPAAELTDLINASFATDQRAATTGLAMLTVGAWSQVYPDATAESVLTTKGQRDLGAAYQKCLFPEILEFLIEPTNAYFKANPATVPGWAAHMAANTPGQVPVYAPIFVAQGTADTVVLPATTEKFVQRMCDLGNVVVFKTYPGVQHLQIPTPAQPDVLAWMAARLRGEPAPSTC